MVPVPFIVAGTSNFLIIYQGAVVEVVANEVLSSAMMRV